MKRIHVLQANNVLNNFLSDPKTVETPVVRMINRTVLRSLGKWIEKYNEDIEDICAEHCLKGEKGEILYTGAGKERTFAVSPESLRKTRNAKREFIESECPDEIAKVDWYMFNEHEKNFFKVTDEDDYNICIVFIAGIPNVEALPGITEKIKTENDEK